MTVDLGRVYTDEDRPLCTRCGARNAVLSKGRLAYKGLCAGCYKADVAERRAQRAGAPHDHAERVEGCHRCETSADEAAAVAAPTVKPAEPEVEYEAGRPLVRGKRLGPIPCGWCCDGNHVERPEAQPDFEDEFGNTVRGLPATLGCVAEQRFKTGPRQGESKGLRCVCHEVGHDRSRLAAL